MMKLRQLEIALEDVCGFKSPILALEQYVTTSHLAACMLHTADTQFGDISGKNVLDLGCGCGILSIGAAILDAFYCVGVDIEEDALRIFKGNCVEYNLEGPIDCIQSDINQLINNTMLRKQFDTVIMNPPFGTKNNKGIDINFLHAASKFAKTAIYSLHKTTTREHVCKKACDFGMKAQVIAEMKYNLEASYHFHKKKSKDISVDFIRFTFL